MGDSDKDTTRERTVWIQHSRADDGLHELIVGDDGGEFARTACRDLAAALASAYPYVSDLIEGPGTAFDPDCFALVRDRG